MVHLELVIFYMDYLFTPLRCFVCIERNHVEPLLLYSTVDILKSGQHQHVA